MPVVTLFLGALINHLIDKRSKLIAHLGFISSHSLKPQADGKPGAIVNTHSVVIKNPGRKAAMNVRLGHHFLPDFNVYPDIQHEIRDLPGGGREIYFPKLIPKKEISINYLYFAPDTWDNINTHIESDEGAAKLVSVLLQPQPKPWVLKTIWFLIMSGIIVWLYFIFTFLRWTMS